LIARIWRGAVAQADGDAYAEYMEKTGVAGYANTPGNQGVWMLRRNVEGKTEFVMFTLWESMEAIVRFAGPQPAVAVFYPEDDRFLVEREAVVSHFEVATHLTPDTPATVQAPRNAPD
jgi:heme-degrading monooxygenase HmoA